MFLIQACGSWSPCRALRHWPCLCLDQPKLQNTTRRQALWKWLLAWSTTEGANQHVEVAPWIIRRTNFDYGITREIFSVSRSNFLSITWVNVVCIILVMISTTVDLQSELANNWIWSLYSSNFSSTPPLQTFKL